ncbi:MAG TPA: phosphoesterase PA-phosphatase, partial [Chitinophagaceae bacterium]
MYKFMLAAMLAACFFVSCSPENNDQYKAYLSDPILYCKTVKQMNNVVLENNFPPMIASRNYAYATIAAYEAMVPFDNRFQSLAGQIKHLPPLPAYDTTGVDFHLASLLAFCKVGEAVTFPEGSLQHCIKRIKSDADSLGISGRQLLASQRFADSVAGHILKWSKKDNYLQLRTAPKFTITSDEGRWVPTPPMYGQAVEPHWKEMRCLVMDSCSQFKPASAPAYNIKDKSSDYYKAVMEVMTVGDSLTEEQKGIADFWDDNPFKLNVSGHVMFATKKFSPPGHWMNIVGIAAKKANADFSTTVAAYASTAIALYDAFISCWDEKFRSNLVRPETVINKHISTNW